MTRGWYPCAPAPDASRLCPPGPAATTRVDGLTYGQVYLGQVGVLTAADVSEWSTPGQRVVISGPTPEACAREPHTTERVRCCSAAEFRPRSGAARNIRTKCRAVCDRGR